MATSIDDYIKSISLHSPRPILLHGYILPFTVIYAVWLYYWTVVYGISEYYEPGLIVLAIIAVAQILVSLSCYWSVQIRAFLTCGKVNSIDEASIAQIVPTVNNGWPELVTIHKQDGRAWFIFQKLKYVFDPKLERNFSTIKFPVNEDMLYYKSAKGLCDIDVKSAKSIYGSNDLTMDIPPFVELFIERATAPFFVFQVFCVGLWCLDEYWYYSVFTLFMLILFEATLVHQQLRNMAMIREMGTKPYPINVYRDSRWATIMTNELLPGDIVSLTRSVDDTPIPCDVLLLQGSCIVDESMLTGESVPVMKECIQQLEGDRSLDLEADSKLHLLFGGTRVVQCTPSKTNLKHVKAPSQGCVGFVLRTSFNSSQGTLLRTILFSVKRITANNLETFLFILFLLIFAIAASSYVWIKGTEDPTRSRYKLFLECTLILTSVVPPELPIELSLAVNSSLLALVQFSIYCTEPFRIPFAGKIDVCCFDKTGTLTSDDLIVDGIAGLNDDDPCALVPLTDAPTSTIQVLASCQSLVLLNDSELVGDPMEKATLNAIQWKVTKSDGVVPDSNSSVKLPGMKVTLRHHFSSSLKRMTVVASQLDPHNSMMARYICTVKGAPETLQSMFKLVPDHYESTYLSLARRGARVIALGYREIGTSLPEKLKQMNREELEKDLVFAGFIALSCPLKPDSKSSMKEIQASSHHIMMITGDNPLTACHIGRELKMTRKPHTLILTQRSASQSDEWLWKSVDETIEVKLDGDVDRNTLKDYDLCITGQGLNHLQNEGLLAKFVPCTSIFARVAPKQKELVITTLKEQGYHTLMCGDGTNDVAALKHAHVGVALLSAIPKLKKNKDKGTDINGQKLEKPVSDEAVIKSAGSVSRPLSLSSNRPLSSSRPLSSNRPLAARSSNRRAVTSGRDMSGRSANDRAAKIEKLLKEMDEQDNTVVKLGDASIASPFTSKYSTINSVCHIIKQGRCTLVTTLQMFKILALNALILAYTQSVLYLDGIKFSDTQATMQGLLLAGCFLFKSRSKPLKTLSKRRPLTNIFNVYTIATVLLQFALHFSSLVFLAKEAHARMPPKEERFVDLERKFEPSLLNSTMYLIAIGMQLSTFAVNYKGKPFMESLTENKPMFYSLLCSCGFLVVLASGLMPDLQAYFEIVEFPAEFRNLVIMVLLADFIGAYVVDSICVFIFEHPKAKSVW